MFFNSFYRTDAVAACLALLFLAQFISGARKGFVLVGIVDGKSFLADSREGMNWTTALSRCNNSNMELATITSRTQFQILKSATAAGTLMPKNLYWLGAREHTGLERFSYEVTGDVPMYLELGHPPSIEWCLGYSTNWKSYYSRNCSELGLLLCETKH